MGSIQPPPSESHRSGYRVICLDSSNSLVDFFLHLSLWRAQGHAHESLQSSHNLLSCFHSDTVNSSNSPFRYNMTACMEKAQFPSRHSTHEGFRNYYNYTILDYSTALTTSLVKLTSLNINYRVGLERNCTLLPDSGLREFPLSIWDLD